MSHSIRMIVRALALSATCLLPANTQAAILVSVDSVVATPGSSGFLEIKATNDLLSSTSISAFSLDLVLTGTGVQLTGFDSMTTLPYIFDSESLGLLGIEIIPDVEYIVTDQSFNMAGFVTLAAGEMVGLARVAYSVDGGASNGFRPLDISFGDGTQFIGSDFELLEVSTTNGGIDVQGQQAVPEPATIVIWLVGAALAYAGLSGRRRQWSIASYPQ